jgi:hypothetical protein
MAMAFIQPTSKRCKMVVMEEQTQVEEKQGRELTLNDRCDSCGAAAYVRVKGVTGELYFCGHHFNKFENTDKMKAFAFEVLDERSYLLGENRAKGEL